MTTEEAMRELRAAWCDLFVLIGITLSDTWLGRKMGLPKLWINWMTKP